jgi:hypothetical protein
MKVTKMLGALLLMTIALGCAVLIAQEKNPPAQHNYAYDQATVQTFAGVVVETRDYNCPVSGTMGSHITLKGSSAEIEVHLAPARFMKQYEIAIGKGDQVTVVGSRITYEGKPALIARTVIIGRDTFNFRDAKGTPLW